MAATFLVFALGVTSGTCHYMMIFAHQNCDAHLYPEPKTCHNWATWVEVDDDHNVTEVFTVSWVGTVGIRFLYGPQQARMLTLEQTLERATKRCLCMTMWGPYRISDCCYERAKKHYDYLMCAKDTGEARYIVLDRFTRNKEHCASFNCIHAIEGCCGQMVNTHNRIGNAAGQSLVDHFRRWGDIGTYCPDDEWVWDAIRPAGYCVRREY